MSEAFISYSRADSAFADRLMRDLEARGIPVWIDRQDIDGGAAWRASISQAIRSCRAFILILSPRSTQSGQVSKELSVAETHGRLIIPVVQEACDIPPGMELQLAELQWINFAEHPYDVALERLTRVMAQASPGSSQAATLDAQGGSARTGAAIPMGRSEPASSPEKLAAAPPAGSRKWLFTAGAVVAVALAAFAVIQFSQGPAATPSVGVLGNSRTLLYHFPGCPGYPKIRSDLRVEFASAQEALRAGYKLSDNCVAPSR